MRIPKLWVWICATAMPIASIAAASDTKSVAPQPEAQVSEASASSDERIYNLRISPMALFYGIFGADFHIGLSDSWALGPSASWTQTSRGATTTTVWQLGPSLIFYPWHTRNTDGPYLHAVAYYVPVFNGNTRSTNRYDNLTVGTLAGYSWVNRWGMIVNLGGGGAFYSKGSNDANTTTGTLGNSNVNGGVQLTAEFSVGLIF